MLPLLIIPPVITVGSAVYKRYYNSNHNLGDDLTNIVDSVSEIKDLIIEKIDSFDIEVKKDEFLPLLAISYATANADGNISEYENDIITRLIQHYFHQIKEEDNKKILKQIEDLKKKSRYIKLSDALEYINESNEKGIKKKIKKYVEDIILSDSTTNDAEKQFLDKLKLFIKKGKEKSLNEIIELENKDDIECYFLSNQKNYKPKLNTIKLLSTSNKKFININSLIENDYYIVHPIVHNQLFRILDLDKIDKFIVVEWQDLARKLGAKKFTCITTKNSEIKKENSFFTKIKAGSSAVHASGNIEVSKDSNSTEVEKNFHEFNSSWVGSECTYTEEELLKELCWLKYDTQAKALIKSVLSNNKPKERNSFEVSLSSYQNSNKSLNLNAAVNVVKKINVEASSKFNTNIQESLEYKQIIVIFF